MGFANYHARFKPAAI